MRRKVSLPLIEGIIKISDDGTGIAVDRLNAGEKGELLLKSTVFYGEKGGQSGDEGIIRSAGGIFIVNDTRIPLEDVFMHSGFVKEGIIESGEKVDIEIDHKKRNDIKKNHTSTHLLHWALRNMLGDQVRQSGSFVSDARLRFDYSVYNALTGEQLQKIERMINEKIQKDDPVRCFETTMEYAKELDAIALFDEKYGKFVRVVEIDDYNRELCGGTHAGRTGEIGIFKIISDSSIGANLRRIEAVTGMHAYQMLLEKEEKLKNISDILEVAEEKTDEAVNHLKEDSNRLKEELDGLRIATVTESILKELKDKETANGYNIFAFNLMSLGISTGIPVKDMGAIADRIKDEYNNKNIFIVLGNIYNEKPVLVLSCSSDIAGTRIDCSRLAREVGKIIKGGGGGRPDFAQLGGSDKESLVKAMDFAADRARESLTSRDK